MDDKMINARYEVFLVLRNDAELTEAQTFEVMATLRAKYGNETINAVLDDMAKRHGVA